MIYAVDFDGCLCKNVYPDIGEPNVRLIRDLMRLRQKGNYVILWTCRDGEKLDDAVQWCGRFGLVFDAVNDNLPIVIQAYGDSRKVYADCYIDDKACRVSFRQSSRTGRGKRKVE